MHDFTLNSLQILGPGITDYIIGSIDGLGEPNIRLTQYDTPGQDGGIITTSYLGIRLVTISGKVTGGSPTLYWQNRRTLAAACAATYDNNGLLQTIPCIFTALDGNQYQFDAVASRVSFVDGSPSFANLQIILNVADGIIYGQQDISSGLITRPSSGGVPFPLVFDPTIEFGSSTGGSTTINNYGNASVWPIIYLRGAMTNPTIYHQGQQKTMQLQTTLGTNDTVAIDMKNKTIVLNGNTSLLSAKTSDSDWFSILPGNNTITFNTSLTSDGGTVEVTFNPGYYAI